MKQKLDPKVSYKNSTESVFKQSLIALSQNPTILLLFILIALLDFAALFSLFLSHSWPFSIVLAPIIRTFWDDRYLHYPENFLLLPKVFNHAHVVITALFGVIVSGIVIKKLEAWSQGAKLSTLAAASPVLKRFFSMMITWVAAYFAFTFAVKGILTLVPKDLIPQLLAGYASALVVQSLLMFIFPAVVLGDKGFLKNFASGVIFGLKNLVPTGILIALPVLVLVIYSFFKSMTPILVQNFPEAVLWVLGGGIFVSMIVDLILTSATTLFYLKARNQK
jgi:hypothetical protein